jgi:hypothetical protein
MGRGAAKQVRDTYPGIDLAFGVLMHERKDPSLLFVEIEDKQIIGWFKVKDHWVKNAEPALISQSVYALTAQAITSPNLIFHMNFPGVGNGGLYEDDVIHLLTKLPDNVIIYR